MYHFKKKLHSGVKFSQVRIQTQNAKLPISNPLCLHDCFPLTPLLSSLTTFSLSSSPPSSATCVTLAMFSFFMMLVVLRMLLFMAFLQPLWWRGEQLKQARPSRTQLQARKVNY